MRSAASSLILIFVSWMPLLNYVGPYGFGRSGEYHALFSVLRERSRKSETKHTDSSWSSVSAPLAPSCRAIISRCAITAKPPAEPLGLVLEQSVVLS